MELAYSPINHKEQLKSLFTSNSSKVIIQDLEIFNSVSEFVQVLKRIENKIKLDDPEVQVSMLRESISANLEKIHFKAIKQTLTILSTDLENVVKEPAEYLLSLFKHIGHLSAFRQGFFNHYTNIQRLRLNDAVKDLQIKLDNDDVGLYYRSCMEVVYRFMEYDFEIIMSLFSSEDDNAIVLIFDKIYLRCVKEMKNRIVIKLKSELNYSNSIEVLSSSFVFKNIMNLWKKKFKNIFVENSLHKKIILPEHLKFLQELQTELIKQIDSSISEFENNLMEIDLKNLNPSFWSELNDNINKMVYFFSTCPKYCPVDSLLLVLRPITNLFLRFRREKSSIENKIELLQIIDSLTSRIKVTRVVKYIPKIEKKLQRLIDENMAEIIDFLKKEITVKMKQAEEGKWSEEAENYFLFTLDNPYFKLVSSFKLLRKVNAKKFAEEYIEIFEEEGEKNDKFEFNKKNFLEIILS